jgi:hypothetical protein
MAICVTDSEKSVPNLRQIMVIRVTEARRLENSANLHPFRANHRLDPLFFLPAFVDAASALETMRPLIIHQVLASEIVFVCQYLGKNKAALYSPQGIARVQELTKQSPNNSPVSSSDVTAPKLTSPLD